jgi:hypothetical protein
MLARGSPETAIISAYAPGAITQFAFHRPEGHNSFKIQLTDIVENLCACFFYVIRILQA